MRSSGQWRALAKLQASLSSAMNMAHIASPKLILTVLACLALVAHVEAQTESPPAADAASAAAGSEDSAPRPALPPAILAQIGKFMRAPLTNPPRSLWQTQYRGRTVFLVPAECCDIPAAVLDTRGKVLCEPFGGITGQGDGRCPGFAATHGKPRLLWKDPRSKPGAELPTPR